MAVSSQPDVPAVQLQLLEVLWRWQQHNPINLFVYRPAADSGELVHPASGASLPVTGQELAALIEQGWLRGGSELALTYAGMRRCRELTDSTTTAPTPWWQRLGRPLTSTRRLLSWARRLRLRHSSTSSAQHAAAILPAPGTVDQH